MEATLFSYFFRRETFWLVETLKHGLINLKKKRKMLPFIHKFNTFAYQFKKE